MCVYLCPCCNALFDVEAGNREINTHHLLQPTAVTGSSTSSFWSSTYQSGRLNKIICKILLKLFSLHKIGFYVKKLYLSVSITYVLRKCKYQIFS